MGSNTTISFLDVLKSQGSFKIKSIKLTDLMVGSVIAFFSRTKCNSSFKINEVKRILIIRPGGIGDAIFLLPILRLLKKNQPAIKIDILCEQRNQQVFQSQNQLTENIFCYDRMDELGQVCRQSYDVVIDTEQWHYFSALLAGRIKSPHTIGFATRPLRTKLFNQPVAYDCDAYELVNFKRLFSKFENGTDTAKNIDDCFLVSTADEAWAKNEISAPSMALYLGASIEARRLQFEQCCELLDQIRAAKHHVILIGGNDIKELGNQLMEKYQHPEIHNYIGQTNISKTAALIKECKKFIGNDSGIMHLSAAVGTPTIGIFGPGNLKKWGLIGEKHSVVSENVPCSPCTRFGYTVVTCENKYQCIQKLNLNKKIENV